MMFVAYRLFNYLEFETILNWKRKRVQNLTTLLACIETDENPLADVAMAGSLYTTRDEENRLVYLSDGSYVADISETEDVA